MGMEDAGETDGKQGKELFLELLRMLPSSQVEDYYAMGRWKDEDMQLDFDLLDAHRKEAGAEDPPALEELDIPPMPDNKPAGAAWGAPLGYQRPLAAPYGNVGPGYLPKPVVVTTIGRATTTAAGLRPQPPRTAPTSAMVAAAGGSGPAGGPSAELRQIALFIAKWKLEATKTKLLLARLTPPRRRWVMSNFSQSGTGLSSTVQLEQYIARCERTNAWGAAESSAGVSGLKRPLTTTVAYDPNKRAKIGGAPPRFATAIRPGVTGYSPRSAPAWLGGSSGSVQRIVPLGGGYRPQMPQRATYGVPPGYGGGGYAGAKPGMPKAAGMTGYQRPVQYGARPQAPKYGGTIKPAVQPYVPKAKGGAKPGSLIANLLRM